MAEDVLQKKYLWTPLFTHATHTLSALNLFINTRFVKNVLNANVLLSCWYIIEVLILHPFL